MLSGSGLCEGCQHGLSVSKYMRSQNFKYRNYITYFLPGRWTRSSRSQSSGTGPLWDWTVGTTWISSRVSRLTRPESGMSSRSPLLCRKRRTTAGFSTTWRISSLPCWMAAQELYDRAKLNQSVKIDCLYNIYKSLLSEECNYRTALLLNTRQ